MMSFVKAYANNQSSDREVLKVWITAADIVVLNRIDLQNNNVDKTTMS